MEIGNAPHPSSLNSKIDQFKSIRSQIAEYIQTISSVFFKTGFTVHDILGLGIKSRHEKTSTEIPKVVASEIGVALVF